MMIQTTRHTAVLSLALAAALALAATGPASAAEWTAATVDLSVTHVSTGERHRSTLDALILDDETVYVPLEAVFSRSGLAGEAGAEWVVRDGTVYVRTGTGIRTIQVELVDGRSYVPALQALGALGLNAGLGNMQHLMVTMW